MPKTSFYFRVSAEAGMAHDENGNNADFFAQVSVDTLVPPEKMAEATEASREGLASMFSISPDTLTPISREEYEAAGMDDDVAFEDEDDFGDPLILDAEG